MLFRSYITFNSYLSYFLKLSKGIILNGFEILLESLISLSSFDFEGINNQFKILSSSCFFHIFLFWIQKVEKCDFLIYNNLLKVFYYSNNNLLIEFFDLLPKYANKVIDKQSKNLSENSKNIILLIKDLMKLIGPKFPLNTSLNLLPYLYASIISFDIYSLDYFFYISKYSNIEQILPYINLFPQSINSLINNKIEIKNENKNFL